MKRIRIAQSDGLVWKKELRKYVTVYRTIIHPTTGKSPAELHFNLKSKRKAAWTDWSAHWSGSLWSWQRKKQRASCMQRSTPIRGRCWWNCALETRQNGQILHHIQCNTTQDNQQDRKQGGSGIANRSEVCVKHHFCQEVRREWTEARDIPRKGGNTGSWGWCRNQRGDRRTHTHHRHSESTKQK